MSPEGLHDDAHERKGRQHPTQLRSRQAGVFLEIKAVVWQHNSHRAHIDEPEERQRQRTKHGAIIASPFVAISYASVILVMKPKMDLMDCDLPRTVHTIGHSTRAIEDFALLLKAHNIELVVDVRRWPSSRRYPHFCREALVEYLRNETIDYLWREDLGGFRKPSADSQNTAWKVGAFRAYADFMLTPDSKRLCKKWNSWSRANGSPSCVPRPSRGAVIGSF